MKKTFLALLFIVNSCPVLGSANLPVCYRKATATQINAFVVECPGVVNVEWSITVEFELWSITRLVSGYGVCTWWQPCPCSSNQIRQTICTGKATKGCPYEEGPDASYCYQATVSFTIQRGTVQTAAVNCPSETTCFGSSATCGYGSTVAVTDFSHTCC